MKDELKFYVIADTHHYALKALGMSDRLDQKCRNETGAILDAVFDKFLAQDEIDIILIAGDLTSVGERESHEEFVEKLRRLKTAGKRVFVITATHDYGLRALENGDNVDEREGCARRSELRAYYNDFGFDEAIAEYKDGLSYVVQLAPGYRLLCLNDDGDGKQFMGYFEPQLNWILEQIQAAHDAGEAILAMTHHPVLPPSPVYPLYSPRDLLGGSTKTAEILADAGIEFIFTGHTHMQNIHSITTAKGNTLWDINTGSLVGFPAPVRRVVLDGEKMTVTTENVESFDWDLGGKSVRQYLQDKFDELLCSMFGSMADDFDRFLGLSRGFGMSKEKAYKYKPVITFVGKRMKTLTLGKLGRWLCVGRKIDKSVRHLLVKDLLVEFVRNLYAGDEPYPPETPVHKAVMAILDRVVPLAKRFYKGKGNPENLRVLVGGILWDPTPDNNCIITRHAAGMPPSL